MATTIRKTFSVELLLTTVNNLLQHSAECYADRRTGMISVLESVLHQTGNYKGYRYLTADEIPAGGMPGIHHGPNGDMLPYPDRFKNTDETRRSYHI